MTAWECLFGHFITYPLRAMWHKAPTSSCHPPPPLLGSQGCCVPGQHSYLQVIIHYLSPRFCLLVFFHFLCSSPCLFVSYKKTLCNVKCIHIYFCYLFTNSASARRILNCIHLFRNCCHGIVHNVISPIQFQLGAELKSHVSVSIITNISLFSVNRGGDVIH